MRRSTRGKKIAFLALLGLSVALIPILEAASKPPSGPAAGGLDGSAGRMQPVNVPARISRVAYDPSKGGRELWAIGQMRVPSEPTWGAGNSGEQTVFLHYTQGRGWDLFGPPVDESGAVANPSLANFAFAPNGEAWAVGANGALVHHTPGGGWVYRNECGPGKALPADGCTNLVGVALRMSSSGAVIGYAVGAPRNSAGASVSTILEYKGGSWSLDDKIAPASAIDFLAVVATGDEEAWAVGGAASRELQIWRRTQLDLAWRKEPTNRRIFDQPAPSSDGGTVNLTALGTAIAEAPDGSVWIAGGINPLDPADAFETFPIPFTLRWKDGSFIEAYCSPQYSLSNDQLEATPICDPGKTMPIGPHDLTSISVTPNGEIFAGGLGLYHYKSGSWFREPDAIGYLSSVAFASPSEGWVAATGSTIGGIGTVSSASSDSHVVGHYTSAPEKPRTSRWPQFNTEVLYSVDVAPDGKRALAVGNSGTAALYRPGIGWDRIAQIGISGLKAVAWSGPNEAWAVGERGAIARFDGKVFRAVTNLTDATLFGLAFRGPDLGYAVGTGGTILVFQGGSWRVDPASGAVKKNLFDVDFAGGTAYAVGRDSTLLVNPAGPGSWSPSREIAEKVRRDDVPLFSVSGLADGTVVVGGGRKTVLRKSPGGSFENAGDPIDGEGSVLEVEAMGSASDLRLFASVSPSIPNPDESKAPKAYLMYFDGSLWRDLDFTARTTTSFAPPLESGASRDPIYGIAVEPGGTRGWAVGGLNAGVDNGNGNYNVVSTSSVYRFDLRGDPDPPSSKTSLKLSSNAAFSFAFVAETGCGVGPCSITTGSGSAADEVALAIQREINALAAQPGGPRFNLFGGGFRSVGLPDELEQIRGYLTDFSKPVFGTLAPRDLYSPAGGGAVGLVPELPPDYEKVLPIGPGTIRQSAATKRFFLKAFANMAGPWGEGGVPSGFQRVQIGSPPRSGLARTHYAFDYAPAGTPIARFAFVDTSDFNYQKTGQAVQNQNPPEDQFLWLPQVIGDARSKNPPIPTFVILSVPTLNPTAFATQQKTNTMVDSSAFESTVLGGGVSAVLSGHFRTNASYYYPAEATEGLRVPFYVMGSGGAPIGGTKYPTDGHFHAWHLVEVDPSRVSLLNPQADVKVHTFPVIESVALHAIDGLHAPGGTTLSFTGLARAIDGGGPPGDPEQIRRTYIYFPLPQYCPKIGPDRGGCMAAGALRADYHFVSEDPSIAQFVKQGFGPGLPLVVDGHLIADDQSGFLCTFKAGSTFVKIVSGTHQMRMPVTVGAGSGPCVKHPVLDPKVDPRVQTTKPVLDPPLVEQPFRKLFHAPTLPDPLAIVLPPAPGPIAAPAPPASAATSRKEEEEHQTQAEGQEGDGAEMRAMFHGARRQSFDPILGWLLVGAATMMGIAGAVAVSSLSRRKDALNYVEQRRR